MISMLAPMSARRFDCSDGDALQRQPNARSVLFVPMNDASAVAAAVPADPAASGLWSIADSGGDRKVHMVTLEEQVEQTSMKEGI